MKPGDIVRFQVPDPTEKTPEREGVILLIDTDNWITIDVKYSFDERKEFREKKIYNRESRLFLVKREWIRK